MAMDFKQLVRFNIIQNNFYQGTTTYKTVAGPGGCKDQKQTSKQFLPS